MARIKKYSPEQNLSSFQTFVSDVNPNSDYFRITEFKDTFTGGKNGFLIEGSEHLKESTEIKVEILDVSGNPIYYEPGNGIPEYYEGISKLIAVYIYDDTPIGLGKITILGELKQYDDNGVIRQIPSEWQGAYNVKWERTFQINKNLANEDKVRFYRRPKVGIDEIVKPIFSGNPPSVTQTGSIDGIPLVPTENTNLSNFSLPTSYRLLVASGSNWTGSVKGQTITFDNINYSPTIDDVVNKTELIVSPPYTQNGLVKSFIDEDYSITFPYIEGVGDLATALTGSFAKINITDMKTFVGDAARIKVFRRSQSNLTDYEFVQEIQLESNELLRDIETFAKNEELYGQFTQQILTDYWVTSSNDFSLEFNQDFLYNSAKLNSSPSNYFFTTQSFSIQSGVEYTLDFNVRLSGSLVTGDYLKVFLSGSTNGSAVSQTITTINSSNGLLQKTNINENIVGESIQTASLYFEASGSNWYINNVSLKASQETSFSPDEITFIQQVPKTLIEETFDYRFEFYDINNNYIPVTVQKTKTFTGGNLNLFEKSISIVPDNLYFSFDSASNPSNPIPPLAINFDVETRVVTGSITYTSGAYDFNGNLISASEYIGGQYPGYLTDWDVDGGRQPFLTVQDFTGSRDDIIVQFIKFTGEVEGASDTVVITRVQDGKGGVSFEIVPFRGTQIKNKESKTLEVQAIRVDGINRIQLRDGLTRNFSEAKLHLLSSSLDGTQTYVSLSQAITNPDFIEGVSAGLTGSGELDYNAIFTRDAIDNELTLYLMDGPTSESILTSIILTDLKDGLNPGLVSSTTEQFNIKYKQRELSPFNPGQSIVTASFQRRGTTLNPLSASLTIYPSSSIEAKTELPQFYMFYETGAFDDTITLSVTDYLGNLINNGIPGQTLDETSGLPISFYPAVQTKQLNLEFTYTEPITSASVTANKSFFITPDGLPGQNAIIIDIDPQPVALGSNHKGEVYNYGLANTDIQVTQGDLFLINTASGDPGTFTTTSIIPTNISFNSSYGDSTATMSLDGFSNMTALSASVRYDFDIYPYFTASLITASRTQKFTKVVEGGGAVEVTLDPIAVAFNADESGFISNYSSAATEVFIKQNDEFLFYDESDSGTPGTFLTSSISASGITFSEVSSSQRDNTLSGDEILHFKGFSGIERTQPSASITYNFKVYPYSLKAGVAGVPRIVSKTQTFSKVNDGSKARKVSLVSSADTVIYNGDGTKVAPVGSVTLTATTFNTTGSAYLEFLDPEGNQIGAGSSTTTTANVDNYLPGAGSSSLFTVNLRDGRSDGSIFDVDTVTISGVQEGSTAYSVAVSNPASSVTVEVDGTKYFDNSGTLIRAYKGGSELQFVEVYDEEAVDPVTFLPIGTFGQFSASIYDISPFLTHIDGKLISSSGQLYGSSSGVSNWDNPQDNTQGFITYKIDFENGRASQFVQQSFSTVFEGATGPGVVFRGPWTGSIEYIYNKDSKRRDAVLWSENGSEPYDTYYATKDSGSSYLVPSGSGNEPTIGGVLNDLYWESLGQEEFFVAAKIAIFEESFVKNTINVGQPATSYATNPQITIYGADSEPYISVGQGTQGYGFQGIYFGVTENGGPNRTSGTSGLLSIEDDTGESYLRWDGYNLEVKSDNVLIETPNLTIDSQNELISIGQGTQGFTSGGVFIGQDGVDSKLSLVGTPVGTNFNALEWDGTNLTIRGGIRQTAAGQIEPSLRGAWADATQYYINDSVVYNGQSWSSDSNHTSDIAGGVTTGPPGTGPWTASSGTGKTANLSADTFVITYDADGTNPSPSTINLFASSSNFVDPYFKFTGGGSNFTDETTFTDGADGDNDSVTSITVPTNISGMPLQFRVGVSEGDQSEVVSDVINIFGVEPGADSTPMYFITPIAGGTQLKNSGGTIELQVQKSDSTGLSDVTADWPQIYDGASLIAVGTGISDGGNGVTYNPVLTAAAITGTKVLTLKNSGGDVLDTITLLDVTDGLGGGSFLSPNLKSTRNPVTNNYLPAYLSITASFFDVTGSEHTKAVKITPNYDSGTDYMFYDTNPSEHTDSEITLTIDDGDGTVFSGTGIGNKLPTKDVVISAEFTDSISGQSSTIVETVYIISDGADGLDAITVILSNTAHTLAASADGTVTSYAGSGTTISIYEGINQLNHDGVGTSDGTFKVVAVPTNITVGSITDDGNDALVGNHSSMTDVSASIQYQITGSRVSGSSFTSQMVQTLTKAIAGTAAKGLSISSDSQIFAFDNLNDTTAADDTIRIYVDQQNLSATISTTDITITPTGQSGFNPSSLTGTVTSGTGQQYFDVTFSSTFAADKTRLPVTISVTKDSITDVVSIFKVEGGSDSAPMYMITSIAGGTQIKNNVGGIELQVQKSDSTGLTDITSGTDARIYDGVTLLAAQTGVTDGGNGVAYNPIISASFITGTKTLSLKDNGGTVLDTITLLDVTDGLGGGSFISPNLKMSRQSNNSYLPASASLTASFYSTDGTEYTKAVKIYPNYDSGTDYMYYDNNPSEHTDSEITLTIDNGDGTVFSGTGIGNKLATKDVVVTAEFTDSVSGQSSTMVETVYIVSDGADGIDGTTVFITNESHTLPANAVGTVSDYVGSGTEIQAYEGATALTFQLPTFTDKNLNFEIYSNTITNGDGYVEFDASSGIVVNEASDLTFWKNLADLGILWLRNSDGETPFNTIDQSAKVQSMENTSGTTWRITFTSDYTFNSDLDGGESLFDFQAFESNSTFQIISGSGNLLSTSEFTVEAITYKGFTGANFPSLGGDGTTIGVVNDLTNFSSALSTGFINYVIKVNTSLSNVVRYVKKQSFTKAIAGAAGTSGTSGADGTDGAAGTPSGIVYAGAWTLLLPDGSTPDTTDKVSYLAEDDLKYVTKYTSGGTNYWVCAQTHRYTGTWNGSNGYVVDDVVLYSGTYYICDVPTAPGDGDPSVETSDWTSIGSSIAPGSWAGGWTAFGAEFTSVATDILFAQDVYADKTVNIGSKGGSPVIALNSDADNSNANPYISIGQGGTQGFGQDGIFLGFDDGTGSFSIFADKTDAEAAFVQFDGVNFTYSGRVTGSRVQGGELLIGFDTQSGLYAFRVGNDGTLISSGSNSRFQGSIFAAGGEIGTWAISEQALSSERISLDASQNQITVSDTDAIVRFNANSDTALPSLTAGGTTYSHAMSTAITLVEYDGDSGTVNGVQSEGFIGTATPSQAFDPVADGKHKVSYTYNNPNQSYSSATGAGSYSSLRLQLVISTASTAGAVDSHPITGNIIAYGTAITVSSSGYNESGYISVTGDTKITLFDGTTKLAKDCKANDEILCWDEKLGKFAKGKISKIRSRTVDRIFRVSVGNKIVDVSDTHGFWVNDGLEIKVQDIIEGQTEIYYKDGETIRFGIVDSVEEIFGEEVVYTFSVPKYLNYVSNELISHNFAEDIPMVDIDYVGSYTFILNNVTLNNGTNYYPYMRTLSTYTVLVGDYQYEISNRTKLNGANVTIVPLSAGVIVNGGGMQSVVDSSNYFRFRTDAGSDPYKSDIRGGLSVDKMYGYDIAGSGLAYLKEAYPWVVKGYGKITHTTNADTTPTSTAEATFEANVGFSSVTVSTSIQGYYNIAYTETYTGKYPTVIATAGIGPAYTGVTGATAKDSAKVSIGVGSYTTSRVYLYTMDQVQDDLENIRHMSLILLA